MLTLSKTTNSRLFQTERGCRRQFQVDGNGEKFSKTGKKKNVGKGENVRYEQFLLFFLLFPHCFKRIVLQTRKIQGFFSERVKVSLSRMKMNFIFSLTLSQTAEFRTLPN